MKNFTSRIYNVEVSYNEIKWPETDTTPEEDDIEIVKVTRSGIDVMDLINNELLVDEIKEKR